MSKIPAVKLQQLMGLDEYELTLAIDRVASELGITAEEVQSELDSVDSGSSSNQIESPPPVDCLLYTSPSPRDGLLSRMPSSA